MIYAQTEEVVDTFGAFGALIRPTETGSFSAVVGKRRVSQPSVTASSGFWNRISGSACFTAAPAV
jgi:hypothetical protein